MDPRTNVEAWNNFVMKSRPLAYEDEDGFRAAAIANIFMGLANNGGINSFLTCTCDLDANDVLNALRSVGACIAAKQLEFILRGLGTPVPVSSHDYRCALLDEHWSDALNEADVLSADADSELMRVLERHVRDHEEFYLALK